MSRFAFLSVEWIEAAEHIHAEFSGQVDAPTEVVRINVLVTDTPFEGGTIAGHIDTSDGNSRPQRGSIDNPEATVKVPYAIARSLFVTQDFSAVMTAFMTGQLEIDGDVTRFLFLQDIDPTPEQRELGQEISRRLLAITAD